MQSLLVRVAAAPRLDIDMKMFQVRMFESGSLVMTLGWREVRSHLKRHVSGSNTRAVVGITSLAARQGS